MSSFSEKLNPFLKIAITAGVPSAVRMHIERGDSINALDINGNGSLHLAALKGHADIIQLLLEAGADRAILDFNGKTAIEVAQNSGSKECVRVLREWTGITPTVDIIKESFEFEDDDDGAVAFNDWEPEKTQIAPEGDESLIKLAAVVNSEISVHQVIDRDTNWDDLDLYLPESVSSKTEDKEWLASLKLLLGITIREGSVPELLVNEICEDEFGLVNHELSEKISRVVYELAGQIDERVGYSLSDWNHDETVQEVLIDEAVVRLEELSSNSTDPMKHYIKDMRARLLLDAEQEVMLGKEIEKSTNDAMVILSRWPAALSRLVEQCAPINDVFDDEAEAEGDDREDEDSLSGIEGVLGVIENPGEVVKLLLTVGLSRSELLKLSTSMEGDQTESANAFRGALASGEKARNTMITSNLRLVLSIARQYAWSELPFEEIVQAGNIGLMKGVDKWDWKRGFKLSTYATWWIRQSISRDIADRETFIRVPVHLQEKLRKVKREVIEDKKIDSTIRLAEEIAKRMGWTLERVSRLLDVKKGPDRFDEEVFDQNLSQIYMELASDKDPALIYERNDTRSAIARMLNKLKERDRHIMVMRFGLNSDEPCTLEECGQAFELTRERVRQVEANAFRTLSAPTNRALLSEMYYT